MIDQLTDLIEGLNQERYLRQQFTNAMLADLQRAMGEAKTAAGSAAPGRLSGGYTWPGLFQMSEDGRREFVLNGDTTQAAESLARGSLDQRSVLQMMAAGASGGGGSVVYQDQRRFDSRIHAEDRLEIQNDTVQALAAAIKRTGRRR